MEKRVTISTCLLLITTLMNDILSQGAYFKCTPAVQPSEPPQRQSKEITLGTIYCTILTEVCFQVNFEANSTWFEAVTLCSQQGGYLASILSNEEQTFVNGLLSIKPAHVWIGLNDILKEGNFSWINSEDQFTYSNFFPGEPNNANDVEHCVEIGYYTNSSWNDMNCEARQGYICEFDYTD